VKQTRRAGGRAYSSVSPMLAAHRNSGRVCNRKAHLHLNSLRRILPVLRQKWTPSDHPRAGRSDTSRKDRNTNQLNITSGACGDPPGRGGQPLALRAGGLPRVTSCDRTEAPCERGRGHAHRSAKHGGTCSDNLP